MKELNLRQMNYVVQEKPNYKQLMIELCGYEDNWLQRTLLFNTIFKKVYTLVKNVLEVDLELIQLNPDITIKYPAYIDFITFAAMMELIVLGNKDDGSIIDSMAMMIAIACYSENHPLLKFDKDSESFEIFLNDVKESKAFDMIGLFLHLNRQLIESQKNWERLFFDVEVSDPDYQQAGGNRLDKFNVINSIKSICRDFNLKEKEAWQISYAMSQMSSLASATSAKVQSEMTKIKENRMKYNKRK